MPDAQRAEIAKLEALHAEHPQGRIFTHLAEAYRKAGELERAREVLARGIGQHPDYSSAHVVLARVLWDQGDPDSAVEEFRRVLELDAQNLVALRALGDIARDAGHMADARDYYRRLLDIEPSDSDVRERLEELERDTDGGAAPPQDTAMEPVDHSASADEAGAASPGGLETFDPVDASAADAPMVEVESFEPEPLQAEAPEPEPLDAGSFDLPALDDPPSAGDAEPAPLPGLPSLEGEEASGLPPLEGLDDEAPADPADLAGFDAAEDTGLSDISDAEDTGLPGPGEEDTTGWVEGGTGAGADPSDEPAWITPGDQDDDEPPLPPGDPGEPAVHTETIAQIYARQGLYEQAAEVYRQLLRQRPDDAGLRARLEEMEGLAAEPAPDVAPLPGLVTSEFEAPGEVAPLAGLESDEVDPGTGLRPTDELPPLEDLPADTVRDVPAPPEEEAAAPWDAADEEGPWAPEGAEPEPWSSGSEKPTEDAGVEAEGEAESIESVWTGADGASAGDESPYAWGAEEPEPDESEPIGSYFESLLGWGGGGGPGGGAPGDAEGHGERGRAASPGSGAEAGSPAEAEAAEGGPDDDDLDTFRSWLESLKQ